MTVETPNEQAMTLEPRNPGICDDCCIAMDIQGDQYTCPQCGRIGDYSEGHIIDATPTRNQGSYRYQSDPLGEQQTRIYEVLIEHRERYLAKLAQRQGTSYEPRTALTDDSKNPICALAPSTEAFMCVSRQYCEIIRKSQGKGKRFTKRKNMRKEVLAVLLLRLCDKGTPFSKNKIAEMLGLGTDGFSRGFEILRMQEAEGNVKGDKELYAAKLDFYYTRTIGAFYDADKANPIAGYMRQICYWFTRRIVNYSLKNQIGYRSQIQSKIIGTIWFAIRILHLPITCAQFEEMSRCETAGSIKKATFLRFASEIKTNVKLMRIVLHYFPFIHNADMINLP